MTAPDPTALLALADQVERLTDGDRSVDAAIEEAIGPLGETPGAHLLSGAPSREAYLYAASGYYTSAPAAALGLVERVMPGRLYSWVESEDEADERPVSQFYVNMGPHYLTDEDDGVAIGLGRGPTLPGRFARAVTAAVLRAAAEPGDG